MSQQKLCRWHMEKPLLRQRNSKFVSTENLQVNRDQRRVQIWKRNTHVCKLTVMSLPNKYLELSLPFRRSPSKKYMLNQLKPLDNSLFTQIAFKNSSNIKYATELFISFGFFSLNLNTFHFSIRAKYHANLSLTLNYSYTLAKAYKYEASNITM
jgi:hypothetical protein